MICSNGGEAASGTARKMKIFTSRRLVHGLAQAPPVHVSEASIAAMIIEIDDRKTS